MLSALLLSTTLLNPISPLSRPAINARSRPIIAYVGPDEGDKSQTQTVAGTLMRNTPGGLKIKDLEIGEGPAVEADNIVSIRYVASLQSTGEIVDSSGSSTFNPPLTFGYDKGVLPLFDEAIEGMAQGGKRRMLVLPSSEFAVVDDQTIEFEIEVVDVKSGTAANLYRIGRPLRSLFRAGVFYLFTMYATELLLGPGTSQNVPLGDAAQGIDAANQWAAQGLNNVGLF